jgi:hypothetical protein
MNSNNNAWNAGLHNNLQNGVSNPILRAFNPSEFFSELKTFNIINLLPNVSKYSKLLDKRCTDQFTITYEEGSLYSGGIPITNNKGIPRIIKKNPKNRAFESSTFFPPGKSQRDFSAYMILCLNRKNKKKHHERECISSIQNWFTLDTENNLKITIDSKTPEQYEGKKYNKLLRLFNVLIIYYLFTEKDIFHNYKSRPINDIFMESQAIRDVSAYLLLQIGFSAVNPVTKQIDEELTSKLKKMTVKELDNIIKTDRLFNGKIYTRYYITRKSREDILKIKNQIKNVIIGGTPRNNTKILKCINNNPTNNQINSNEIRTIRNSVNINHLLSNSNAKTMINRPSLHTLHPNNRSIRKHGNDSNFFSGNAKSTTGNGSNYKSTSDKGNNH